MPLHAIPPVARALIRKLSLIPHPEGGHFREIHRAAEILDTARGPRAALTVIYFLLAKGERSLFHRVHSDEVWHHHAGAPLRLWRVSADFSAQEKFDLGPLRGKRNPVAVIPAGDWQGAEPTGDYSLVSCSVGPGFDFADFTMLRDDEHAAKRMRKSFPERDDLI